MTVSGHLNYEFSGNWCSKLHKDEVMDLPYSTPCKAYLACNIELDRALEFLIKKLEEAEETYTIQFITTQKIRTNFENNTIYFNPYVGSRMADGARPMMKSENL